MENETQSEFVALNHIGHSPSAVGTLVRLKVFQVAGRHKQLKQVNHAISAMDRVWQDGAVQSGAVLRGTRGKHVVSLALVDAQAEEASGPNRYTVEYSDHIAAQPSSKSKQGQGTARLYFLNIVQLAPGKREVMIRNFERTMPYVRKQPGYISTNLLVSRDNRLAIHVGQFESRRHFQAIFRKQEVLRAFGRGLAPGMMATICGVLPKPPSLHLFELAHVVGSTEHNLLN
ncbi:antibiotic biosynthesis monooxygenase [Paenibacillus sp. BC26]|uniref:antibiotic biosynthesis monooxygenase family protein n=1 Tax=Paenibacillus sp. BC26 TaxID=1881032 RepID=UPI0008E48E63|nr:antibiotic biosynthesis monooxygenase [Paenibacillus sp. BC26]SFT24369.1 Heme-degrading monooxygenase HmoA [Paenibacillus sp. BC26]